MGSIEPQWNNITLAVALGAAVVALGRLVIQGDVLTAAATFGASWCLYLLSEFIRRADEHLGGTPTPDRATGTRGGKERR